MARLILMQVLKKKRLSKRKFAKLLKTEYSNVFRYFRPTANPTLKTLSKWADVLGVKVRDLIKE
jgi:transcriptional regulator with XRE-family HTH domain